MQFYTKIIAESGVLNILADIMVSVRPGEIILISTGVEASPSRLSLVIVHIITPAESM